MTITGRYAALVALTLASSLGAQSGSNITRRVADAPDGEVRLTYAARANACGDGKDIVAIGEALNIYHSMESYGRWSGVNCVPGPVRVAVTVRDHQIVGLRTHIGGAWPTSAEPSTDLGHVPARDAAAYFISLVPLTGSSSRLNPLLAAAAADSTDIAPEMLKLARSTSLSRETRRRATHWAGMLGDATVVGPLVELTRSSSEARNGSSEDPGPGDGIEGAATGALSMVRDGAGIPALMSLARQATPTVRKAAVFWLGQRDEPAARALVRAIANDAKETDTIRGAAIFALGHGDNSTAADATFLRGLFGRLESEQLKDRVLMAISQSEMPGGGAWLLAQARDDRQPMEVRRKAVFWAGQGHVPVAEITALYRSVSEGSLREHIIFVLAQRDDELATSTLINIARNDPDHDMRKKALFWLAQKDDPRVTKMITDLVVR